MNTNIDNKLDKAFESGLKSESNILNDYLENDLLECLEDDNIENKKDDPFTEGLMGMDLLNQNKKQNNKKEN